MMLEELAELWSKNSLQHAIIVRNIQREAKAK